MLPHRQYPGLGILLAQRIEHGRMLAMVFLLPMQGAVQAEKAGVGAQLGEQLYQHRIAGGFGNEIVQAIVCLLYTSDAADE